MCYTSAKILVLASWPAGITSHKSLGKWLLEAGRMRVYSMRWVKVFSIHQNDRYLHYCTISIHSVAPIMPYTPAEILVSASWPAGITLHTRFSKWLLKAGRIRVYSVRWIKVFSIHQNDHYLHYCTISINSVAPVTPYTLHTCWNFGFSILASWHYIAQKLRQVTAGGQQK